MSLKRPLPLEFCSSEIILPEEVLIQIWTYLDFKTVQNSCTRVSKSWFEMIRNSKLSWEMKLRNSFYYPDVFSDSMDIIGVKEFNAMLFHWKNLRLLHFSSETDFDKFCLSLNSHKSLEKVIIPSGPVLYTKGFSFERTSWGWVTEYWIDPSELLTPTDTIKNVIKMKIDLKSLPKDLAMIQKECDLTNLETLEINKNIIGPYENRTLKAKTELLFRFKNLKNLNICLEIDMNYLLDILHFLGNTKNVKLSVDLEVRTGYDEEEVEEIFQQALDIVNEKFPFPDVRILDLKTSESELWIFERQHKFSIHYGESGAILTKIDNSSDSGYVHLDTVHENSDSECENSDSELENSESIDESIDDYDYTNENGETSNNMDEFVENSNSIDETVENSDTEDINVLE